MLEIFFNIQTSDFAKVKAVKVSFGKEEERKKSIIIGSKKFENKIKYHMLIQLSSL